jgi:hypothetical protein
LLVVDVDYTFLVFRAERLKLEKDYLELQSKAFAAPGSALVEVGLVRAQSHAHVAAVLRLANVECVTSHVMCRGRSGWTCSGSVVRKTVT